MDDTTQWIFLGLGALAGIITTVLWEVFSRIFDDELYGLRFRRVPRTDNLIGDAHLLHSIQGQRRVFPEGGASPIDQLVELTDEFPVPNSEDTIDFELKDVIIKVKKSGKAIFEAKMDYEEEGLEKSAKIFGRGHFVSNDPVNWAGPAAFDCEMKETSTNRRYPLVWTVSCFIRREMNSESWKGFWFLYKRDQPEHANFGRIELKQAPQENGGMSH